MFILLPSRNWENCACQPLASSLRYKACKIVCMSADCSVGFTRPSSCLSGISWSTSSVMSRALLASASNWKYIVYVNIVHFTILAIHQYLRIVIIIWICLYRGVWLIITSMTNAFFSFVKSSGRMWRIRPVKIYLATGVLNKGNPAPPCITVRATRCPRCRKLRAYEIISNTYIE